MPTEWSKELYERSVSSHCWSWTPYDDGWENCIKWGGDLQHDEELQEIVAMEKALECVPEWADQIVRSSMNCVAPCGHITFPCSYLDVIQAIGAEKPLPLNHTCYTVDRRHKQRLQDLAFMLDAWIAGASPDNAAGELQAREAEGWDWQAICSGLWKALSEPTELKTLLAERFLHQLRWWVKETIWDGDLEFALGRDQYLGNWLAKDDLITGNGNRQLGPRPGIDPASSPRVQRWEAQLAEICPDWPFFHTVIAEFSWPCAPKAFRYYEKLLWCIGRERQVISLNSFPMENPEPVPAFLGPLAVPPDKTQASAWWNAFIEALEAWWRRDPPPKGDLPVQLANELGVVTPLKRWLVRLYLHRLRMLQQHSGILDKLVSTPAAVASD